MVVFDPTSAEFRHDRNGVFRAMRDDAPVLRAPDGSSVALSRYDDVLSAALDRETFSSELLGEHPPLEILNLFDPPTHTDLRAQLSRAFSPQRVHALEPEVRTLARSLVAELGANRNVDLITQLTRPLTTGVMGLLLGFSEAQAAQCQTLSDAALQTGPDVTQFVPFIQELASQHLDSPRDDLMSALLGLGDDDGAGLSESALLGFCWGLIMGNNCTAMNSLSNGIALLAEHPDQWRALAEEPSLVPQAYEEMMRLGPPTHTSERVTTTDVELHGVTIPAGTQILLVWGAASLDERRFDDPDRFDIHREPDGHLALGWGNHFCIGAGLARMEARVMFEELLAAFPRATLQGELKRMPTAWQWGLESIEVSFDA